MHKGSHAISIWFFIGLLLSVYGVLILGAGVYGALYPPEQPVVLEELHAGIWWGALLFLVGAIYSYRFSPKREK